MQTENSGKHKEHDLPLITVFHDKIHYHIGLCSTGFIVSLASEDVNKSLLSLKGKNEAQNITKK